MENRKILNTSDIDGFDKVKDLEHFFVNFFSEELLVLRAAITN